jgi:Protein of unknown function (DUF2939)
MRKIVVAALAFVALCAAYVAWPFASLYEVVRAAQAGDAARIEQRVDFPALRRSLVAQLIEAHARLSGKRLDRSGLTVGIASGFASPLVEQLVSPATLAEIMRNGWPNKMLPDKPAGVEGLDSNTLGNVWQLYLNSDYGIGEARFSVPVNRPKEKQFRVRLALSGWTWKLSGLDLPWELQERLAREFVKQDARGLDLPRG